jgi:uncharacterized protein
MAMRKQDSPTDEQAYFLSKEEHSLGHNEPHTLTVEEFRQEQGVDHYDEINHEWRQIILKKRSAGATIGKPSARRFQFFFYRVEILPNILINQCAIYRCSEK